MLQNTLPTPRGAVHLNVFDRGQQQRAKKLHVRTHTLVYNYVSSFLSSVCCIIRYANHPSVVPANPLPAQTKKHPQFYVIYTLCVATAAVAAAVATAASTVVVVVAAAAAAAADAPPFAYTSRERDLGDGV